MSDIDLLSIESPEPEEYDWNRIIEEVAEEEGCKILRPKENELFIDIDGEEQYAQFQEKLADLLKGKTDPKYSTEEWPSRSGLPKRHLVVRFENKTFTPSERVLFQLLLGSDPKREFLDGRRLFHGVTAENTTCFFEPK